MSAILTRRTMLTGLTMTAAAPTFAQLPTNPDVIVIGAGAAGMEAAHELARQGLTCVILEAANRTGGRAWTESETLGQPVDHGCSWLNQTHTNPLVDLGRRAGLTLVDHTDADTNLYNLDGQPATDADWADFERAYGAIDRAVSRAGRAGQDVPAASVLTEMPWGATVRSWSGAMDYGMDYDRISTMDYWEAADNQPAALVKEGLGTIIATLAPGLPVSLNTPVTAIDWSGPGVTVHSTKGSLTARACILTVSTGVLTSGQIRFTPELPEAQNQAAHDIPMGLLMKVPLLFDGTRLGMDDNSWLTYRIPEDQPGRACYSVAWPCGHDYVMGFIGGSFAWEAWAEGEAAVVDYALDQMVRLLGSDIRKHFVKGLATDWATNPHTLGSYGAVRPGAWGARETLAQPIGDKLFYAGEAVAPEFYAYVHGAYLSGRDTAKAVAKTLS